jgi:DegV family protein with EDD domain
MQIVTDSGTDIQLSIKEREELNVHVLPLIVTLDDASYREGIDIEPTDFYDLLEKTEKLPVTSQPSMGDFAELYRKLISKDRDIISIQMSSGLSGTINSAKAAAKQILDGNITILDTKTLSVAAGWQVRAAAKAAKAGLSIENIKKLVHQISEASDSIFTLNDLKYLIHGGRISHMKGLLASILNIKPQIGVEKEKGTYVQMGQARTFKKAVDGLVELMKKQHPAGSELLTQVMYSFNPDGGNMLRDVIDKTFKCTWLPMGPMSLVLGAHTGPSMVGVAYAPASIFPDIK